jgi:hypothetical protein
VLETLRVRLDGLDAALLGALQERFGPFLVADDAAGDWAALTDAAGALSVTVGVEAVDYFIDPPSEPERNPVLVSVDGETVRYLGYRVAARLDLAARGGTLLLASGDYEPAERAIENLLRVAVAWMALTRGGALVHAASAVRGGRAYLFYGESGAGKSTLSASNRRGRVVSDDLTLVLPDPNGAPEIVGSPFRGTYEEGPAVQGRFPLAAGFRIVKAKGTERAEVRPVARLRALAELVGNLPFTADCFHRRPDLFARVERTFASCPLAHLHFRKDDGFWDAIERAGM